MVADLSKVSLSENDQRFFLQKFQEQMNRSWNLVYTLQWVSCVDKGEVL